MLKGHQALNTALQRSLLKYELYLNVSLFDAQLQKKYKHILSIIEMVQ